MEWLLVFNNFQGAVDFLRGEDPRRVPFIPRERPAGDGAAQSVQKKIVAEADTAIQDVEAEGRAGKPFERLTGKMPEALGGQVMAMRRVGEGIVRAEVRSDDVNFCPWFGQCGGPRP